MRTSFNTLTWLLALSVSLSICFSCPAAESAPPTTRPSYECRFTDQPITIDGKIDEKAWAGAQVIDNFRLWWLQGDAQKPRTATRARLLWDRDFLYFAADMDDADLIADRMEHQGMIWQKDVFELFMKPADDKPAYLEFEVNPLNTTLELYFPSRGSGGYFKYKDLTRIQMQAAVALRGTVNQPADKDQGWSVEAKIPWKDLQMIGGRPDVGAVWKFAFCRCDYSTSTGKQEQSSCAPLTKPDFHHFEDYANLQFVGPQKASAAE